MEHLSSGEVPNETPERKKRKRIYLDKTTLLKPVEDPHEFTSNMCGEKAKKAFSYTENVQLEILHHKHYHDRHHIGDEYGKRVGIDPESIESLIRTSVKYLIACCTLFPTFCFVHHSSFGGRASTIVLQRGTLNVAIQAHYMDVNKIEITVITALLTDGFRLTMGQFALEMHDEGPILKRKNNNTVEEIFTF